jgi:ammonia channel protein AmtB
MSCVCVNHDLICCLGLLAGSVASTSGCAVVPIWSMVVVGCMAGFIFHIGTRAMLYFKIDDPVQGSGNSDCVCLFCF